MNSIRHSIKSHNMELQFWGYEGGNILAAIAGAGGIYLFHDSISTVVTSVGRSPLDKFIQLAISYPDVLVTLGIGVIVLLAPVIRQFTIPKGNRNLLNAFDATVFALAALVLIFALNSDSGWLSVAGSSFVVASAMLRHCHGNPFLLKSGGLALVLGGVALALHGNSGLALAESDIAISTYLLTIATGFYVAGAGFLTYEGGIYQSKAATGVRDVSPVAGFTNYLINSQRGHLAVFATRHLDGPIQAICKRVVYPSIFWVGRDTKRSRPFQTSMLARLPWRLLTGLAALATLTPAGIAFAVANLAWAVGDIAIGSEDWAA